MYRLSLMITLFFCCVYVDAADAVTVDSSSTTSSKPVKITNTDESTSKDTGALEVDGGLGIEKNLNVGGNAVISGTLKVGGSGPTVDELSTDGTLADNSDTAVPTEKAVKAYVDDYVYAFCKKGSAQSLTKNSATVIDFDNVVTDTDCAVTTGSGWKFTAPEDGIYRVCMGYHMNSPSDTSNSNLFKNGSHFVRLGGQNDNRLSSGSIDIKLDQGDYIQVKVTSTYQNSSIHTAYSANLTWISVTKY